MSSIVKRGYSPKDKEEFGEQSIKKLRGAAKDLEYLLNRGYPIKGASTFIGNHYLLSERQRLALVRTISSKECINKRKEKEIQGSLKGETVYIDGFNTIITLEVALSGSLLLKCMDGTVRDLAGLRGTYRVIDKTDTAISLIGAMLEKWKIGRSVFYLDAPVSNSGRLKQRILEKLATVGFEVQVEVINEVDRVLEKMEYVISSDAIILNKCVSWINLNERIIADRVADAWVVDLWES